MALSWDRRIWEIIGGILRTDEDGNSTLKVSFENDSSDTQIDPGELQMANLAVTTKMLEQLQLMNIQLATITGEELSPDIDIDDSERES